MELRESVDSLGRSRTTMTLRTRLFLLVGAVVALTDILVTTTVGSSARRAFAAVDDQRTAVLVTQVRREFAAEGEQVAQRLERVASSDEVVRLAADLGRSTTDAAAYVGAAAPLAASQGLDFLDLVSERGTIISSAHAPARFGYRHPWLAPGATRMPESEGAFLQRVEFPNDVALGLVATRSVASGEGRIVLVGGRRLDDRFLKTLVLPAGTRVLLYRDVEPEISHRQLVDASGVVADSQPFEPLIERVRQTRLDARSQIARSGDTESVAAIPLQAPDGAVRGVLLVASSGRELAALVNRIRWSGLLFGALGLIVGWGFSYVVAARVTRPVEELADAARAVAVGRWDVQVHAGEWSGEVGALARAFRTMTEQLAEQRDRLVQAERVAAWRELARRLAHELKNPLFPLRLTVDNLNRAKSLTPSEFDEVFEESMGTLTAGLTSLNAVIGRFSDFARMPVPQIADVSPNDVAQRAVKLFQAQLASGDRPPIRLTMDLDPSVGTIAADGEQLGRALTNLLVNAIDAMPQGGDLTIRTRRANGGVRFEVSDTGHGLTDEERQRLFAPYYTTKQHGTGLGLAIVQSVVADHHGRIWVDSEPGRGTTFHIELHHT
jgi:two-component system, NtrC family, nitrogen regulation sensor histidine kinase NtrY